MSSSTQYFLQASGDCQMPLHFLENRALAGAGASTFASFSGYWKQGAVKENESFSLTAPDGSAIPMQTQLAAYWPDGSLKWTFHTADFAPETKPRTSPVVEYGRKPAPIVTKVSVAEANGRILVDTGALQAEIFTGQNKENAFLGKTVILGRTAISQARLLYVNEQHERCEDDVQCDRRETFYGKTESAVIEEQGDLQAVICLRGVHVNPRTGKELMPFTVRLTFRLNDPFIRIQHTFVYTGDAQRDCMKTLAIAFDTPITGNAYNRHIMFAGEEISAEDCRSNAPFHEANKLLLSWHPKLEPHIYPDQIAGKPLLFDPASESTRAVDKAVSSIPAWNRYTLYADSADHWRITKGTGKDGCTMISAAEGRRTTGAAALSGEDGGIVVCQKDFWQKYPSSITFSNIASSATSGSDTAHTLVFFWPKEAEAKEFCHYDTEGHAGSYYEGYDFFGADAYGIANTNELVIGGFLPHDGRLTLSQQELDAIARDTQKPALLVSTPQYYHDTGAFGIWSLPRTDGTKAQKELEKQIEAALAFYKNEIEARRWYGFFDYGDVMHTYDPARHCWRYDMGGYAWQNTELVPTLWLWYSFLRTGREDIYTMAEAMSRHASEVDIYHEGKYKGLGSRHNVIHWGCPCKEARIAMAGHHRFAYYLGGDRRYADIFDIVKDADFATLATDPLAMFYDKKQMILPTHARSGPDWSTYTSNWLTEWERHGKKAQVYEQKIRTGIADLQATPFKLASGNNFEYDPQTGHLGYIGESTAGGAHLVVCMGGPQTWFELVPLLGDAEWEKMLADFGVYYFSHELPLPFTASAMGAFAARYYKDKALARKVWDILLHTAKDGDARAGAYESAPVPFCTSAEPIAEIPAISTNTTSQFCLNAIVCLELIGDEL